MSLSAVFLVALSGGLADLRTFSFCWREQADQLMIVHAHLMFLGNGMAYQANDPLGVEKHRIDALHQRVSDARLFGIILGFGLGVLVGWLFL
ncbi:MAG: hypothetical protein AAFY88_02005 [Acidobacteriota bacterium]